MVRFNTRSSRSRKKYIILMYVVVISLVSIGYATLQKTLSIQGTADITTTFDVRITNIYMSSKANATNISTKYSANSGTINVELNKAGGYGSYRVTVKNNGNFDVIINKISGITEANNTEPKDVTVSISGITEGTTTIAAGSSINFYIRVDWSSSVSTTSTAESKVINFSVQCQQAV